MGMKFTLTLLGLLLALLWMSEARAEVLLQPDFNAQNFSGLWYVVAMVSDCKAFLSEKDHLLMSTQTIEATEEGHLHVHMELPQADNCSQVDVDYLRVGSAGHFRVPALGYLDVRISDTDYSSFAVVYIYKELEGALSTLVQLFSRTQDVSPEATKAFQDFYPKVGLPDDMAVTLPKSGLCADPKAPETQGGHCGCPPSSDEETGTERSREQTYSWAPESPRPHCSIHYHPVHPLLSMGVPAEVGGASGVGVGVPAEVGGASGVGVGVPVEVVSTKFVR
ncbi:PREDICTED: lipocalin-15 [Chrysochloris asiatica]|uniref:Lipocalin-15 n=1 Tax=Chrysochloris asiatica TaxID=185453 RepID=A0A9B0TG68_CHRAS|nr:PREDICTED: lipocalin-15 [Chrysochloris asiatica]